MISKFSFDGLSITVDLDSLPVAPPLPLPTTSLSQSVVSATTAGFWSTYTIQSYGTSTTVSVPASNFSTPLPDMNSTVTLRSSGLDTGGLVGIIVGSMLGAGLWVALTALLWTWNLKKMDSADLPALPYCTAVFS